MLDEGRYKTSIQNIHKIGWTENYFKSDDVSMLSQGCVVSQYPQFDNRAKKIKFSHIRTW